MTGFFQAANAGERSTRIWVFAALGIYWLALIHQLGAQWSVYEQYNYGWAVPFLCGYLLWQRKQGAGSGERGVKSDFSFQLSGFQLFALVLCAMLYAPTRFFHEANPIWRFTSLLWAIEVIIITVVLLRLALRTSQYFFPVCFFLVAVPWPSGLESALVQSLTRLNVASTVEILGWLGIPALQHANVIEVATGEVGVVEACSGIRSFEATLMIALFFGELYRLNLARRLTSVFAGFALSFLFNLGRTTLLTWVAARKSVAAVAGWHDPAGITILVGCFVTLWLLSLWLARQQPKSPPPEVRSPASDLPLPTSPALTLNNNFSLARRLAVLLLAWFVLVEGGVQWWYRSHESAMSANSRWLVNPAGLGPRFVKVEMPPGVKSQFRADESLEGGWKDDAGNAWHLYYFRWLPARSLEKRVANQLAKTHGPEKCLPAIGMILKTDMGVVTVSISDRQFAFRQFLFLAEDRPFYVFYAIYEDSSGSSVLANRRQNAASRMAAAFAGSRNNAQRFLELAVAGPKSPDQARTQLRQELEKLIAFQQ